MERIERIIGDCRHGEGPTFIATAGIHGNEPGGVYALQRVFKTILEHRVHLRGRFIGIAGNLAALRAGQRFLSYDMNRAWTSERMGSIGRDEKSGEAPSEDTEIAELATLLDDVLREAKGFVYHVDLHSTSGPGYPFGCLIDSRKALGFVRDIPLPFILDLNVSMGGTLMEYLGHRGAKSAGFEGGQNEDPRTVDALESAVWAALENAELLPKERKLAVRHRARLSAITEGLPHFVRVFYRHGIETSDDFAMRPGYENFQAVSGGELLATDASGEIRCERDGRILFPLYQGLGNDGFFLIEETSPTVD